MSGRPRKAPREKDLTSRYFSGNFDEDSHESHQRFTDRSKNAQQNKMEKTGLMRASGEELAADLESLPIGRVIQVYSLFSEVEHETGIRLCTVRKTLSKLNETAIVVGDRVRFRDSGVMHESGRPEAVIEGLLPRQTVLTRAGSFHGHDQQPIVANAEQMLIVASLAQPNVKWGLIDRIVVAAQAGGLVPIICLNKMDLEEKSDSTRKQAEAARLSLAHYQSIGIPTILASSVQNVGVDAIRRTLSGKTTVVAGHSGVGKSSLISAVQPGLDLRVGAVSRHNEKGRHTTTTARRYPLDGGGFVIDTPGVKQFGLWKVTPENLLEFFPDIRDGTATPERAESYERIGATLGGKSESRNSND